MPPWIITLSSDGSAFVTTGSMSSIAASMPRSRRGSALRSRVTGVIVTRRSSAPPPGRSPVADVGEPGTDFGTRPSGSANSASRSGALADARRSAILLKFSRQCARPPWATPPEKRCALRDDARVAILTHRCRAHQLDHKPGGLVREGEHVDALLETISSRRVSSVERVGTNAIGTSRRDRGERRRDHAELGDRWQNAARWTGHGATLPVAARRESSAWRRTAASDQTFSTFQNGTWAGIGMNPLRLARRATGGAHCPSSAIGT